MKREHEQQKMRRGPSLLLGPDIALINFLRFQFLARENTFRFQKTVLEVRRVNAIDRSRAPTTQKSVKFPAALFDIHIPVGIIMARNISMPGLKHCHTWGLASALILLMFFLQLLLKRNFPLSKPAIIPRSGAVNVHND